MSPWECKDVAMDGLIGMRRCHARARETTAQELTRCHGLAGILLSRFFLLWFCDFFLFLLSRFERFLHWLDLGVHLKNRDHRPNHIVSQIYLTLYCALILASGAVVSREYSTRSPKSKRVPFLFLVDLETGPVLCSNQQQYYRPQAQTKLWGCRPPRKARCSHGCMWVRNSAH